MRLEENLTDEEIQKLEEKILQNPLLKIQNFEIYDLPKGEATEESIRLLLNQTNYRYTIKLDGCIQCNLRKNRSLGDLFCIARYYYPTISLKRFREILNNLINTERLAILYCGTIEKRVYYTPFNTLNNRPENISTGGRFIYDDDDKKDEYGYKLKKIL
jgi:hypothetical protein